ncbi:gifsy-2 prophage RecT [Salmonella enterica subsp. enterica serovar Typhimurium str. DT104]|nr:gifsy-2 prophage RecT [Salmonella enterica subsp. enterica serovar Typhimurium str. DT104]
MLERQFGEVSEWLKEHAWKVCIRQRIGGSTLGAAKRHLGDELHDKYRVTLDDMKPEYIG